MRKLSRWWMVVAFVCSAASWGYGFSTVTWQYLGENQLKDQAGVVLSAGEIVPDDDGALLELLAYVGPATIPALGEGCSPDIADPLLLGPESVVDHPDYELLAVAAVGHGMQTFPDPEQNAPGRFNVDSLVDVAGLEGLPMLIRFWNLAEKTVYGAEDWYNELFNPEWVVPEDNEALSIDPDQEGTWDLATCLQNPYGVLGVDEEGNLQTAMQVVPEPGVVALLGVGAVALRKRRVR